MTVEHANIINAELHEPKDVSAATVDKVYVSDGAASGDWEKLKAAAMDSESEAVGATLHSDGAGGVAYRNTTGWAHYADNTYTIGSPLAFSSGVRKKLENDGVATGSDESRLTGIWDKVNDKFTPDAAGDAYILSVAFKCQASGTGNDVLVEFDIGGTPGIIDSSTFPLLKTGGATNDVIMSFPVFIGSTFITNGGTFYITASANTDVWDIKVVVIKHHSD